MDPTPSNGVEMRDVQNNAPKELTVEEMLPLIGDFGTFQKLLVLIFVITLFAACLQPVSTFITLSPTWTCTKNNTKCVWNGTFPGKDVRRCTISRAAWIYSDEKYFSIVTQFGLDCERNYMVTLAMSIFFVGWMIGAVVCGSLADRFGRKITFIPCVTTIFVLEFASPFVDNMHVVVLFRFLIGCAFPGLVIQTTVLLTEFTGTSVRPIVTGLVPFAFNVSWMVLGAKAYYLQNWKYLSIACTAPYAFVPLFYFFIPESARWLHLKSRNDEAMQVLHNIAKWNKRVLPCEVTLMSNISIVTVYRPKSTLLNLFKTRTMFVKTFVIMFVWVAGALQTYGLQFAANDLGGTVYLNFVLLSAAGLPGTIVAAVTVKGLGRKVSTLTLVLLGSIACFVIAGLPNSGMYKVVRLVLGIFGKFCSMGTLTALYIWTPEIYSTNTRAFAMGVVQLSSRVGAGLSPLVVKDSATFGEWIPFVIIGIVSILAAGLGLILPETKGKQLREGWEDE